MGLFKSKTERFIAKRVLIFFIIMSIICFVFAAQKWLAFGGLTLGSIFGLLRFNALASTLASLLLPEDRAGTSLTGVIRYIISVVALVVLLIASISFNIWFFAGMTAGILLVPVVIFINGITEGFGITHNNFE